MAETITPTYTIRYATEHDVPEILHMIRELATYERALHEVRATEESLFETLSFPTSTDASVRGKHGFARTLLIVASDASSNEGADGDGVAGMALYFNNYSTWLARPGIFLEDLFVRPTYRRRGFGKALLQALARECVREGYGRLEWSVLKWNAPSIEFYESEAIGAVSTREEWEGMRVTGEALVRLAGTGGSQ